MKRLLHFLFLTLLGCSNEPVGEIKTESHVWGANVIKATDSCEYVVYVSSVSGGTAMVHSGNCHNPKHNQK